MTTGLRRSAPALVFVALALWLIPTDAVSAECRYRVTPSDAIATEIEVAVECDGGLPSAFAMSNGAGAAWAGEMSLADGTVVAPASARWEIPSGSREGAATYRLALRAMAEANGDYELALAAGGSILASLEAWLAIPAPAGDWILSIAFDDRAGGDVATALPIVEGRHRIAARWVRRAGPTIFGTFHRAAVSMPAPASLDGETGAVTTIDLVVLDASGSADADALTQWVADSGHAVAEFWRGFPVERPLVALVPVAGSGVPYGRVVSVGGITAMILVGHDTVVPDLYQDWVLIHEMLHLGSPYVRDTGPWLNEGIATLYEPIVRMRAGWKTREEVWQEWIEWMSNGLRALGEVGLEQARGGGVYWGGALFLLLAEIEVRERSALALGIEDCLRTVRDQGGTIDRVWTTDEVLAVCDAAYGGTTLADLAARHLGPGEPPDLEALWTKLGVSMAPDGTIQFDDTAPLAAVRDAILDGGPDARWQPVPIAAP